MNITADVEYVKSLMPSHYNCEAGAANGIRCKSGVGIDDDERWGYTMLALRSHFSDRLSEVYHMVCTNHLDFIVYLRQATVRN